MTLMVIKRNKDVYTKKIKGRWIILEKNKRFVRELNEVGGLIWEMTKTPISIDKIASKISSIYKASVDKVKEDVEKFVKKYLKEGFLIKVS